MQYYLPVPLAWGYGELQGGARDGGGRRIGLDVFDGLGVLGRLVEVGDGGVPLAQTERMGPA